MPERKSTIALALAGAALVLLVLALLFLGQRDEARKAQATAIAEANGRATAQAEAIVQRDEARKVQATAVAEAGTLATAQALAVTAEAATAAEVDKRATAEAEAIAQRDEAVRQVNVALVRQLAAQAQAAFRREDANAPLLGALLAVESHRRLPSSEAYLILSEALGILPAPVAHMTHDRLVAAVAFSPGPACASPPEANAERCGQWVVSASWDDTARVRLWQPEDMIAAVCARLPRNFTRAEWRQYLEDVPYRATCPNLPEAEAKE
jgi:hypothetical protein